jgi:proton-dependent oligopeptide transporter, POT family
LSTTDTTGAAEPLPAEFQSDRSFLGHPRGLGILAHVEGWVGFSYYGMRALLVLYMTSYLLTPGHIDHIIGFGAFSAVLAVFFGHSSGQALAVNITAFYGFLTFATPLLGAFVADRFLGRTRSIVLGASLMTLGHFLMAFDVSFVLAFLCLAIGSGMTVLKAQVGGLYAPGDQRRDEAFQIYSFALQVAVIAAPFVCGTLGEKVAWHWGFGAAGIGMAIGLVVYLLNLRWMPPDPLVVRQGKTERPKMTAHEWRSVGVLLVLVPILAVAFIGNNEIFAAYLLWGKANFQLVFFGQTMPVSWLISIDAFVSAATTLVVVFFWRWWASWRKEPDEIVKIASFTFIAALAPLALAAASVQAAGGHKVGLAWGLAFHIINDIGFSGMYPYGMAMFSRVAPPAVNATLLSCFTFCVALSNLLIGKLAALLGTMPDSAFWALHAGLIAIAGVLLLVCSQLFKKTLAPTSVADL